VSHEYHKNPDVVDAMNQQQYGLTQEIAPERSGAASTGHDCEYERAHQWREATRDLVLAGATAMAAADPPQSQCSISITLTGNALSNDLLLADTGSIVLTSWGDRGHIRSHPMRVVPMRLDLLSDLPVIRVLGRGVTEPTRLRLLVELTARNPHTDTTSVMTCEYDSVLLDAQTSLAVLDFQLQHGEPHLERPRLPTQFPTPGAAPPARRARRRWHEKSRQSTRLNSNGLVVGDRLEAAQRSDGEASL
jgi:hypothetical protein